ncbi:MAG: hypothetical protein R2712_15180 [Vicinamibacterales bacterium]
MDRSNRRRFLAGMAIVSGAPLIPRVPLSAQAAAGEAEGPPDWLPRQNPAAVQEVVGASHRDLARVRDLVERQPALANAAIDWGFGDWESALGAASHTGRREIAELLLAHGARPSIFSAAMLGQLDVVKAFVSASPGIQRTHGPHGITLLAHARAGRESAAAVVTYLESLGDADRRSPTQPLEAADRDAVVGEYAYGPGAADRFIVDVRNDQLALSRPEETSRFLFHTGGLVFFPSGAPAVRIAFARSGPRATQFTIADPDVYLTARRR